ncbi:tuftelin-interacting protein 11 [Anolis sagrei]|uniref:tuftelin-interacting protein 11 n=1 Tax=Anolis sagrei TaxID=38937 RepID=UPI003520D8F8
MSLSHLFGGGGGGGPDLRPGQEAEAEGIELEAFEVTEWDLQNEFNPLRHRQHRQTKEQALYGVWAEREEREGTGPEQEGEEDSDDEEQEAGWEDLDGQHQQHRPSFAGKRSRDYSAPVNFISAGLKKTAAEEIITDDEEEDSEEEGKKKTKKKEEKGPKKEFVPKRLKTGVNFKPSQRAFFGGTKSFLDFGSWERHTKGIGQKLLQKMGYVPGRGLGKNAQGILTPIEAKQRRGKGALGAYGSERTAQSLQDFPVGPDLSEEEEEDLKRELGQWRKEPGKKRPGPKYSYKTAEELKARGRGQGRGGSSGDIAASATGTGPRPHPPNVKVIDMTGREQRVYYSYSQISQKTQQVPPPSEAGSQSPSSFSHLPGRPPPAKPPPSFSLPELEHNLQLLIDLTEEEILQSDRRVQAERDRVAVLGAEIAKAEVALQEEEAQIHSLEKVLEAVETCEKRPLTLEEAASIFRKLQREHGPEYHLCGPDTLAAAIAFPLVREHFRQWQPLKDCSYGTEIMAKWKSLLENDHLLSHGGQDLSSDAFHRLMWETWMPIVRGTVSQWQARDCIPMVDFLDCWEPIIPVWIMDNILDQLIFPKLQKEVEGWNPLTDTVPIHAWVHPWLPLMRSRLEPLYAPIRSKLSSALQKWHPSDASAKLILQPWKDVFTPGSWEAFMLKNILPKLGMCLNELVINPHQQHMDAFFWVMDWEGMISVSSLVGLLEKYFFPKWLQVLCSWLSNNPNYEEITKWYLGWKSMFSDQVLAHPSVKEKFNEALDIMNRAVSSSVGGYLQPGARENIAYLTHTERCKDFQYEAMQERREAETVAQRGIGMAAGGSVPMNFKDLIQAKAEEHNIVFMPVIGKRHEGKQLYTFGRIVIYIDRGVVFVQGEKTWVPTSLQSLIDMAK